MLTMNMGYQVLLLVSIVTFGINSIGPLLSVFVKSLYFIALLIILWYFFKDKNRVSFKGEITFLNLIMLARPMMIGGIVFQINNFVGQLLLSIYSKPENISYFAVIMRVGIIMSFVFLAIMRVTTPKIAFFYKERKINELEDVIIFSNRIMIIVSTMLLFFIIIFGKNILSLFGNDFLSAYPMLIIIIVGQYIAANTGISVFILQMTGYQKINRNNEYVGIK